MDYRQKRKEACKKLFQNFVPDVSNARNKDVVLKIADLFSQGYYSHEIAEMVGKTPKAVQKTARRYNFPSLHNFFPPELEERVNWKGGIKMMKGYAYKRTPNHPNGTKHGNYVAVHRLVVEKKLGRYLTKKEVVDHIDGDITNNHPDNLRVFPNNAEHLRVTLKGKRPNWSEEGKKRLSESSKRQWRIFRESRKASSNH